MNFIEFTLTHNYFSYLGDYYSIRRVPPDGWDFNGNNKKIND